MVGDSTLCCQQNVMTIDWWHHVSCSQMGKSWYTPEIDYDTIKNKIGIIKIYLLCFKYHGESGQDTNTKLFWKSVVWKFDIWDSSLVVFKSCQLSLEVRNKNRNKPPGCACGLIDRNKCLCVKFYENNNKTKNHCHIELSIIHTTKQVFKKLSRNKSNQTADLVLNQTWHLNQIWQNNPQIGSSQVVHS